MPVLNTFKFATVKTLLISMIVVSVLTGRAQDLDPSTHYYVSGQLIQRSIALGDPDNWSTSISGFSGSSEGNKISVSPDTYQTSNDAIRIQWLKGNKKGQFSIYGETIDLSAYENQAMLVMDMNIKKLSKTAVLLGMDCTYPCRSELDIRKKLKKYPKNKWFTYAIPLNCISNNKASSNFDISKVNGPFLLSTDGRMDLSLANIRLALLPEGETGCAQ